MNIMVESTLEDVLKDSRNRSALALSARTLSRRASRLGWTDQRLCAEWDSTLLLCIYPTRDSEFEVRIGYDDKFDLVINDCSEGGVDSVDIEGTTLSDVIQRMHDMALAIRQQPASNTIVIPQTFEVSV